MCECDLPLLAEHGRHGVNFAGLLLVRAVGGMILWEGLLGVWAPFLL
jgi:hypothetical protein